MIQWEPKYQLGIPKVDTQHMALVALINRLETVQNQDRVDPRDISESLKHLMEYIRVHFADEEVLMKTFNFADLEKHQDQHRKFVEYVESFQERFDEGETNLAGPILHFLSDWLLNHIAGSDREYADFFQQSGLIDSVRALG